MAQRRMFSLKIVDTDAFLDMSATSQLLYFHLSMRADDDGFVSNPKKIMKIIGSQEDDLKVLFLKRFVLPFESGVCVIKHWKIHNYIQNDRYTPTQYVKERAMLEVDEPTQKYRLKQGKGEDVSKMDTQVRVREELELIKYDGKNEIPSFQDGDIKKDPFQCPKSVTGRHNFAGEVCTWCDAPQETGRKLKKIGFKSINEK